MLKKSKKVYASKAFFGNSDDMDNIFKKLNITIQITNVKY